MQSRRDFLKAAGLLASACALLRSEGIAAIQPKALRDSAAVTEGALRPEWWEVRPLYEEIYDETGCACAQVLYQGLDVFHHSYVRLTPDLTLGVHDSGPVKLEEMARRARMPAQLVGYLKGMLLTDWWCHFPEVRYIMPAVMAQPGLPAICEISRQYRGYPVIGG